MTFALVSYGCGGSWFLASCKNILGAERAEKLIKQQLNAAAGCALIQNFRSVELRSKDLSQRKIGSPGFAIADAALWQSPDSQC
jgi:hypothetical protein